MSLTVGAVTDYLVSKAQTAVIGITVSGKPVTVVDGEPWVLEPGMFVIGVTSTPTDGGVGEVVVRRELSGSGDGFLNDDFTVPCYIDIRVPGTASKTPRDLATAVFDAFWDLLAADLSLGGAIEGGMPAEVPDLRSTTSNVGTSAEPGRRHLITFGVRCINLTK